MLVVCVVVEGDGGVLVAVTNKDKRRSSDACLASATVDIDRERPRCINRRYTVVRKQVRDEVYNGPTVPI